MPTVGNRAAALLAEVGELYAVILRISRRIEEHDPMTATQRLALIQIAAAGPLRLCNLASRMDTTPATASRAVDTLEEFGLVERRSDPLDGRAILIAATRKGRSWSDRRRDLFIEVFAKLRSEDVPPHLVEELGRLNVALRDATGHDDVARGSLLAP